MCANAIGIYELKPGFIFDISISNGRLFCQPTGQSKLELVPISELGSHTR